MSPRKLPQQEVSLSRELAETKRENHKLKRQLAKMQKRLVKAIETEASPEVDDEVTALEQAPKQDTTGVACPSCDGPVTVIKLGTKALKACKNCGWRKMDAA